MKAEMTERGGGLLGTAQKLKGKAQSWHANREAAAERRKAVAARRAAEQAEAQAWQVQEEANRKLRQMEEVAEGERLERQRWEEEYALAEERRRQEQEERRYEQEQEERWQEQEREREREWRRQEQEQAQKQQRWHERERERQQREQDTRMLPAGWSSAVSRSSGDVYYINIATGHTTYEFPEASALPPGAGDYWDGRQDERHWQEKDHDEDEVERRRRRLQELLRDGAEQGQRARQFSAGGNVYDHEDGEQALPEGWSAETSRTDGATYYYNSLTGESTFDFPSVSPRGGLPRGDSVLSI